MKFKIGDEVISSCPLNKGKIGTILECKQESTFHSNPIYNINWIDYENNPADFWGELWLRKVTKLDKALK